MADDIDNVAPYEEWTVEELQEEAKARDIEGRSSMLKAELVAALEAHDEAELGEEQSDDEAEAPVAQQFENVFDDSGNILNINDHAAVLKAQELAAFEREVYMTEQRLKEAKQTGHEPTIDRLTEELVNARKQFKNAGGKVAGKETR